RQPRSLRETHVSKSCSWSSDLPACGCRAPLSLPVRRDGEYRITRPPLIGRSHFDAGSHRSAFLQDCCRYDTSLRGIYESARISHGPRNRCCSTERRLRFRWRGRVDGDATSEKGWHSALHAA